MGSAIISLMLFVGIMLLLRAVLFGIIPYWQKKKQEKQNSPGENRQEKKEQD